MAAVFGQAALPRCDPRRRAVRQAPHQGKMEYLRQFTDDEIKCIADKTGFRQVALVFAKGTLLRGVLEEYVREYDPDDFDFEPGPPPEEEGSE